VLQVHGKGSKIVLVPLPPAVGRAIDWAITERSDGPILLTGAVRGWTATARPDDCDA
jgi:hypothetical protein